MNSRRGAALLSGVVCMALTGLAALLLWNGTLPALRAQNDTHARQALLAERRNALEQEVDLLEAELHALRTDFQYNRRLERRMFRTGPASGD